MLIISWTFFSNQSLKNRRRKKKKWEQRSHQTRFYVSMWCCVTATQKEDTQASRRWDVLNIDKTNLSAAHLFIATATNSEDSRTASEYSMIWLIETQYLRPRSHIRWFTLRAKTKAKTKSSPHFHAHTLRAVSGAHDDPESMAKKKKRRRWNPLQTLMDHMHHHFLYS